MGEELGKATGLQMVALERGPLRSTNPDFLMDHFDEWRYAVQGQLFQDLNRETWTFRNNTNQTALPVRQYGSWLPGNGVGGATVVNTYKQGVDGLNGGKQVRLVGAGGQTNFNKWNNSQGGYIIVKYTATGDEQQISQLSEATVAKIIQAGGGG